MTLERQKYPSVNIAKRTAFDIVKASGENILTYLQGQITQDINKLSFEHALYAVVLNPQGKATADFHLMLMQQKEGWAEVMFLCPQDFTVALIDRLKMFAMGYELRIGKVSSWQVISVQGEDVDTLLTEYHLPVPKQKVLATQQQGHVFALRMLESSTDGVWLMGADIPLEVNTDEVVMEKGRVLQGTPRLGVDWTPKLHPLNANLVERDGVSFDKGCYVGQEVTSRMQWRGGIKKKLYRVQLDKAVSLPCPLLTTVKVGEITSLAKRKDGEYVGIALLPIEVVEAKKSLKTEQGLDVKVLGVCGT